jgi:hypothetical protein
MFSSIPIAELMRFLGNPQLHTDTAETYYLIYQRTCSSGEKNVGWNVIRLLVGDEGGGGGHVVCSQMVLNAQVASAHRECGANRRGGKKCFQNPLRKKSVDEADGWNECTEGFGGEEICPRLSQENFSQE